MARISDIAEAAAVSVTTVSRYLNGRPYVSHPVAERIAAAIEALGYHPNQNARTLRSGRTGRVAILVNRLNHRFYSTLVEGVAEEAHIADIDLLIHQSGTDGWSLDRIARQARERAVDGLIVCTGRNEQQILSLATQLPVVSCDQALTMPGCPQIYIDHFASTTAGLEHLAERGAKTILAISGSESDHVCSSDMNRRSAFEAFRKREGAPELLSLAVRDAGISGDSLLAGSRLLKHIRNELPRADGVFAGSDEIAAGLAMAARSAGVTIPEELRILGFDDQPIAEAFELSTIHQPIRQMGRDAMFVLADLICDRRPEFTERELEYRLVVRKST